ncbi:hypothetical protein [Pandoraea communis]|uniref:hypothetical protein n=1 Tax=Pandoraea communis TaxID=2508297 RepID=UPI0025A59476|nr:hypothetical protein [Pandoraea communis]MDM8356582.1 hypothetical protein [Pandoraea communis]
MPDLKTVTFDASEFQLVPKKLDEVTAEAMKCARIRSKDEQEVWDITLAAAPTPAAQSAGQEAVRLTPERINELGRESFGSDWDERPYRFHTDSARHFARAIEQAILAAPVNGGEREVLGYVTKSAADYFVNRSSGHKAGEGLCISYKRHNDTDMVVYVERAADASQAGEERKS